MFAAMKSGGPMPTVSSETQSTPAASGSFSSAPRGDKSLEVKVFNIPDGTEQNDLRDYLSSCGEVTRVNILPLREGKDTTLGFVTFADASGVQNAISQKNNEEFRGSNLRITENTPRREENNNRMDSSRSGGGSEVKVYNIPEDSDPNDLRNHFSSCGEVVNVRILPLREGKVTTLGFVTFSDSNGVQNACAQKNNVEFNGSSLRVMENNRDGGGGGGDGGGFGGGGGGGAGFGRNQSNGMSGGDIMLPDSGDSSNACRRCGESGHWAKECTNAPMGGGGTMAVTYVPPELPENETELFEQGIHTGINFDKFDCIPVELSGNNASKPIGTFQEAQLHKSLIENVRRAKYARPTPVQKYALPAILAKRDLMACAQTGSGKTGAFLLPIITNILNEGPQQSVDGETGLPTVCVLSPTRELAVQIFTEAKKFSYNTPVRAVVVYGGVSVSFHIEKLLQGCHILVATPGRLDDFIKRGRISFRNLQYLVLDEADKMLDMGFGPAIKQIINNSEMPPRGSRTTLMFSATFPDEIQKLASEFLNDYLFLTVGRVGGTCADVSQVVLEVSGKEKKIKLEQILQESGTDRTLVFVEKKKDADFLAMFLSQKNFPATSMNGDRSQQERESALKDFRRGVAPVLIATAVAARGLDINDVKHVINFDLPTDLTEYVHRIGRTGRIGNKGLATSFYDHRRDEKLSRGLVKLLSDAEQEIPEWLEDIALKAAGTGYGMDNSHSRDQRTKHSMNGHSSKVDDDEDEDW